MDRVLDLDDMLICRKNSTIVKRPGLEEFLSKMAQVYSIKDCTRCRQGFVKDVSQFATLVWVDDVRLNFRPCLHNGISDRELEKLTPLFLKLSKVEDVTQFLWNGQPKVSEAQEQSAKNLDLNETLVWKKDASTIVNRPGLEAFLSRMAMAYSVVIFSVSDSRHLDQSVAGFGASAKLITDVYGIEDCTRTRTGFIKDVRKVKVRHELKRLVWVDNERFHFRLCSHNGIEIKPFRGEADDEELERLTPLLLKLSQVDDVTQFLESVAKKDSSKTSQIMHWLSPEKIEMFKSLESWAEESILPFLRPVEKCWQPQDYLPEPSSESFYDEVRELRERDESLRFCLVGDMTTEEALPTYLTMLNTLDGTRDETGASPSPWAVWGRAWTAEENRHGDLLNKYLYRTGRVDMKQTEKTIQAENNPYLGFIYTSFQEQATAISHGNTACHAKEHGDHNLATVCGLIAADEKRHENAYTRIVEKLFEIDPEGTMLGLEDMMRKKISMPAHLMGRNA
ncbi:hypothetical protein SELMODRAFT_418315 [Selaginella moellendorffii]|uniref:FCP1 homology domain-containing protein n=1 Tax=Selaginella moellendorffii TaxID=88036 RepID=D8S5B5_SELML|nr:hypothetical protein SELMODRAFT_418315 [Selaginella moellendorffii]